MDWTDLYYKMPYKEINITLKLSSYAPLTISGFCTGGEVVTNLFAMFNDRIFGAAVVGAGGPCATRNWCHEHNARNYSTKGLKLKQMFYFITSNNIEVPLYDQWTSMEWFRLRGVNMTYTMQPGGHMFPNDLPEHYIWNPNDRDCEKHRGMISCKYDLAQFYIDHLFQTEQLWPHYLNYNRVGQLYVID